MILLPRYPKLVRGQPIETAVHAWESRPWMREEVADCEAREAMFSRIRTGGSLMGPRRPMSRHSQRGFIINPFGFGAPAPTDPDFANVSLLLHYDNNLTDHSGTPKTVTAVGNAAVSAGASKFGGYSGFVDGSGGTGSCYTVPDHTHFNFPTQDFTLETWFYLTSVSACILLNKYNGGALYPWQLWIDGSQHLSFRGFDSGGSLVYTINGSTGVSPSTWYFAQGRRSGNTFACALNGAQEATTTLGATTLMTNADVVKIGNSISSPLIGYVDDTRITKSVARTFALPTAAFPNS